MKIQSILCNKASFQPIIWVWKYYWRKWWNPSLSCKNCRSHLSPPKSTNDPKPLNENETFHVIVNSRIKSATNFMKRMGKNIWKIRWVLQYNYIDSEMGLSQELKWKPHFMLSLPHNPKRSMKNFWTPNKASETLE